MVDILQRTSKLESLVLEYILETWKTPIDAIDATSIGGLLSPVRNTLNRLVLSYTSDLENSRSLSDYYDAFESPSGVFRSCCLDKMTALRYLEAPFIFLFGPHFFRASMGGEFLPPNLVELKITSELLIIGRSR